LRGEVHHNPEFGGASQRLNQWSTTFAEGHLIRKRFSLNLYLGLKVFEEKDSF